MAKQAPCFAACFELTVDRVDRNILSKVTELIQFNYASYGGPEAGRGGGVAVFSERARSYKFFVSVVHVRSYACTFCWSDLGSYMR